MATSTWTATAQTGDSSWADDLSPTHYNHRVIVLAASISTSGDLVRFKLRGHSTNTINITGLTIGERTGTTIAFVAAPTKLQYSGADISSVNPMPCGGGTSRWTDWVSFALDETKDYLVHIWAVDGMDNNSILAGSVQQKYYSTATADNSETLNPASYSNSNNLQNLEEIEVDNASSSVNVHEDITLTEAVIVAIATTIDVHEDITLTEDVTANVGEEEIIVNAHEDITLTEEVAVDAITCEVNKSESITVTEAVAADVAEITISQSVTVTEEVTLSVSTSLIDVSDGIDVTDIFREFSTYPSVTRYIDYEYATLGLWVQGVKVNG